MTKRIVAILVVAVVLIVAVLPAWAHERKKHDADIEIVLFGKENYKDTHPKVADIIQALEDAVYLAVDQFNGNGAKELENLRSKGIKNLPRSIDEINFTGNNAHRLYTHRGWNLEYTDDKANWTIRKSILKSTVQKMLFSNQKHSLDWLIHGKKNNEKQIDSFCALLYYIHILGDHIEAEKYTQLAYIIPLVRPNDKENSGLIPELQKHLSIMLESQQASFTYYALMGELDNLKAKAARLISSTGGINTDEKFKQYHDCAEKLKDTLTFYLPDLLMNESFFSDSFKK